MASNSEQLNEVVVTTAFGISRTKKSLGYGNQEVKGEDLTSGASGSNFLNQLSGKAAGVNIRKNTNFGGSTNVVSRGVKNLTGDNQMLIVIDGMTVNNSNTNSSQGAQSQAARNTFDYGNNAMDINPDDIETLNILKGAAAAALYGWQAGNGVIVITTKKGKSKKGMGITISSEFTSGKVDFNTFARYQKEYGAGYAGEAFDKDANDKDVVTTYDDASYGPKYEPGKLVYQWDAYTQYSPNYGKQTEWKYPDHDATTFFKNASTLNNSISFEDGDDKSNFVLNYNNFQETGILPNSELKKNNFSVKVNHKFTDRLSTSVFANYVAQKTVGRNTTGYGGDNIMSTFRQFYANNVDILDQKQVFETSGGQNITWNMKDPSNGKTEPLYSDNPYFTRFKNVQSDERNRFLGYAQLDYKIADWVSAMGRVSTDSYSELREERKAVGSLNATFGVNRLSVPSGYQKYQSMFSEQNYQFNLTFKKNISDSFTFSGLTGVNSLRTRRTSTLASTEGGLIIPGVYALSNSVSANPFPVENELNSAVNSLYGSASFGYKDFLFIEGTIRNDAFSTLPKGNNDVNTFSASGSYVFSKNIMASWLSFGKLRASYAENPQGSVDLYALNSIYDKFNSFGANQLYSVASTGANESLKPVKTATQEVGLEMQMFDRKVGFDVSIYKSLSSDQIFPVDYSTATGNSKRYINAGSIENRGIEIQLNLTPFKTNEFSWDININWSTNKNEVVALAPGISTLTLGSYQGGVSMIAKVGNPYGDLIGKDYTYTPNGEKITNNGVYVMTTTSTNVIGNVTPDWIGGIRNKFTYKQISLGFLIDMQKGGDIFSLDQYYGQDSGMFISTVGLNDLGNPLRNTLATGGGVIVNGIDQTTGLKNTIRIAADQEGGPFGYSQNPQKAFIYDASYIKLREANITYTFPSKLVSKMNLTDLRLSLVGSNLWTIHKNLPDADPESGLSSGNTAAGFSGGSLPTTRNIGCNLTLKF